MPYPVRKGPPGGHTPAEVTEDPEHNHARLQAAGTSLWEKKYSIGSGNHVYGAPGTRADAQGCEPGPGGTPVGGGGTDRLASSVAAGSRVLSPRDPTPTERAPSEPPVAAIGWIRGRGSPSPEPRALWPRS